MWDNPFFSQEQCDTLILRWAAQAAVSEGLSRDAIMRHILLVGRKAWPKDVADVIGMCDLGLYPYRAEGWNLPLLETMACGLPVIATYVTGPKDFLTDANAYLIGGKESAADDGVFFGPGRLEGNWYEPNFEEAAAAAEKAYNAWSEGRWELNKAGVRTAQGLSWTSAAHRIIHWLEQGCVSSL